MLVTLFSTVIIFPLHNIMTVMPSNNSRDPRPPRPDRVQTELPRQSQFKRALKPNVAAPAPCSAPPGCAPFVYEVAAVSLFLPSTAAIPSVETSGTVDV